MRFFSHSGPLTALSLLAGGLALVAVAGPSGADTYPGCMGIVIDEGDGSATVPQGVDVTAGSTTDLQAMIMAGDTVTQNNSGLVCGINNYPADPLENCLNGAPNGEFYYWSYWEGDPTTNTWTYANIGPASHTVSSGQDYVEGWRYQDPGADNPNATEPSVTPRKAFAQACDSTATTTTTTTGGGGSGPSSTTTTAPTPPTPAVAAAPPGVQQPTTRPSTHGGTTTTSTTLGSRGTVASPPPTDEGGGPTTNTTGAGSGRPVRGRSGPTKLAAADASARGTSGSDPALPIIVIAAVIVLLGGLSWFRWRRRPAEE